MPPAVDNTVARERWERAVAVPLAVLGLGFIAAYSVLVLAVAPPRWLVVLLCAELVVAWLSFLVDLVVRTVLSAPGHRLVFLRSNPLDVLSVALPLFRAFRVVGLIRGIPYFHQATGAAVRAQVFSYAVVYAILFIYFLALATFQVERDAEGATITTFGTAVWWACVTVATVGYGDVYPVTAAGRVYAVVLMAGGVAIVGTATALIVSYLGDRIRKQHQRNQ
jgi:voltage-gated potassium channel